MASGQPNVQSQHKNTHNTNETMGTGTMTAADESTGDPLMMMAAASGVATLVLASGLAYAMTRRSKQG
jgi:hypothetical protein